MFGGYKIMDTKQIRLRELNDVKEFVKTAMKCEFDIDVFYNRIIIDAKSLLGVMSLDLSKTLNVACRGFDQEFDLVLQKFEVR
jgi:phosphotransferase system HPr-like phosphotransfer protein